MSRLKTQTVGTRSPGRPSLRFGEATVRVSVRMPASVLRWFENDGGGAGKRGSVSESIRRLQEEEEMRRAGVTGEIQKGEYLELTAKLRALEGLGALAYAFYKMSTEERSSFEEWLTGGGKPPPVKKQEFCLQRSPSGRCKEQHGHVGDHV